MAVKKCRDCGGMVGASATRCPHCGGKVRSRGLWIFLLVLMVAPYLWYLFYSTSIG